MGVAAATRSTNVIYFAFTGTDPDVLRATGIATVIGSFEYIEHNGMLFGIVHSHNYRVRLRIDALHASLKSLPGPAFGKLLAHHAEHIKTAFPSAKANDSMVDVLQSIYNATGHEGFNPNHH